MSEKQTEQDLFWIKYRPNKIEDVAMSTRVRNTLEMGLTTNMVLYGTYGIGKTTVSEIIADDYYQYKIDGKIGVDELRTGITRFCKTVPNSFGKEKKKYNKKIVFIDEFDNATNQVQNEMKAFIEKYSDVRFLFTCNNIGKVEGALDSRFTKLNFDCVNDKEHQEVRKQILKRLKVLNETEKWNVPIEVLQESIISFYPDFRKTMQDIQLYVESEGLVRLEHVLLEEDFFKIIMKVSDTIETWDYVKMNWNSRATDAFKMLSQRFFDWIKVNHPDKIKYLPGAMDIISEFADIRLPYALDPFNTLYCTIYKLQKVMSPEKFKN
jgi:DNA polymerase III delta prime subunit